ncbi:YfhE family protein [Pallidibacillus pasinlerensis]|uniref:YfhE family protein n=1 Tax=Pallidibacillus pasinlerensis TaxID=2703818 RepID=A0ABX0A840_9BACI|nr:YfhE family protein [Pallidibacillus pasinlerensis]NCU17620.1 YfhE family protein [Pallidibacillus pasinlerensis]
MAKKDKNKGEKKTLRKAQEITYNREFKRADRAALSDD